MKKLTLILALAQAAVLYAAESTRYKDRMFDVEKTSDVVYATGVPQLNKLHQLSITFLAFDQNIYFYQNESSTENVDLKMDIYTPKNDNQVKRAAVIVVHGGAMIGGAKDKNSKIVAYCDSLAARGFVAASIDYRLGVTVTGEFSLNGLLKGNTYNVAVDSADYARAVYRGVQDVNAAVRYMRANADKLGIDSNRIYLVGNSTGAILSFENIYANSKDDFFDYLEYDGVPTLGDLNDFGEQGVGAHANGGVFLWGGVHDPKIVANNRIPVLLVHGEEDSTVLFKTGRPLQNFSLTGTGIPKAFTNRLLINLETPTLYGSFVVDSTLSASNGEKANQETYFVEGQKHEFYDNSDYTDNVKTKVFDFLYKLATSNKVIYDFGAITITEDNKGIRHASVDGEYNGSGIVSVDREIPVNDVVLERTFNTSGYSTVVLPFSVKSGDVSGAKQFLDFVGVERNAKGRWVVQMKRVWCDEKTVIDDIEQMDISDEDKEIAKEGCRSVFGDDIVLSAYKPYFLQMQGTKLTFSGAVTFEPSAKKVETVVDDWILRGTLAPRRWTEDDAELGYAYGYSAINKDNVKIGDFIKAGKDAYIKALRCYLLYSIQIMDDVQGVRRAPEPETVNDLPESMEVVIVDRVHDEEKTTVIGRIDTRTGEFTAVPSYRAFDLKGRSVGKGRSAAGMYLKKRIASPK